MLTRVARRLRRVELEVVVREPARRTAVGRRRDQPEARQRILDAAEAQFAQDGFDATPTARIAEQAGVPKGLLFYYFPKKIDVLRALLAERLPVAPLRLLVVPPELGKDTELTDPRRVPLRPRWQPRQRVMD